MRFSLCGALLAALAAMWPASARAQAPGYPDWNAGRDLILNEKPDGGAQEAANPNATVPQWSYGYRTAIADTALTLYTAAEHYNSDSGFQGFDGGPRNGSGTLEFAVSVFPALNYPNLAPDEIYTSIDTQSPDGNNVIRWTCPAAGTYSYRISWRDIDGGGGDGAAGYLVINGVQKFKGTWSNGNGQGTATTGTVALKAGDKFDVVLNANSADSSYDSTGTRIVIVPGGTVPSAPVSLPLTTSPDNRTLDLGAFRGGTTVTLAFTGAGDVVDSRWQVKPDGTLAAAASGSYSFANEGAPYPTVNGGDGINHYPGGGAAFDNTSGLYGFAGSALTDTTVPGTIRIGAVVGTFSATPSRGDWFLIGSGATVTVPTAGAHLYLAVNDVPTDSHDNHGAYTGTVTLPGGTGAPTYTDWNAGRDFANNENYNSLNRADVPNGLVPQWSYGYRDTIASTALNPFQPGSHIDNFGQVATEHGFVANGAGVSVNVTTAPIFLSGNRGPIPPGNMAVDAFMPAYVSVVRWTAPAAGTFTYAAFWRDIDPNGGNGAGGYVVVNGKQAFGQTWDNGTGNGASTSAAVVLQSGDTIDFVLDDKGDGGYDETLFNATVAPGNTVPLPVLKVTDSTYSSSSDGSGATAVPGDRMTYAFSVRNTGDGAANNVAVTAGLNGTTFRTASDGGTLSGSTVTWKLGTLAAHSSRTLTVTSDVPATYKLDGAPFTLTINKVTSNEASVSAQQTLSTSIRAPYQTSISYNANVSPGGKLSLRFTTRNLSETKVTGLKATVHVPSGTNFVGVTDADGKAISGSPDSSGNVTLTLPAINSQATYTFVLVVQVRYDTAPGTRYTLSGTKLVLGSTTYTQPNIMVALSPDASTTPPSLAVGKFIAEANTIGAIFAFNPSIAIALQIQYPDFAIFNNGEIDPQAVADLGRALNPTVNPNTDPDVDTPPFTVGVPGAVQAPYVTIALSYSNTGKTDATDVVITDTVPAGFAYLPDVPRTVKAGKVPGNPLGAPYAFLNGKPFTGANLQVTNNGHNLKFTISKVAKGASGLILYQAQIYPTPNIDLDGPDIGETVKFAEASLATPLLGKPVVSENGLQLLAVGPAHAITEVTTPQGNVGSLAVFNIFYRNDGGLKARDLTVLAQVPANATVSSARFLDNGLKVRDRDDSKHESIEDALDGQRNKVFHLGKVKPRKYGYLQLTLKPIAGTKAQDVKVFSKIAPGSFGSAGFAAEHDRPMAQAQSGERAAAVNSALSGRSAGSVQPIDNRFARFYIQQTAPFAVKAGETYQVVVAAGLLNDKGTNAADLFLPIPAGADFVSLTGTANGKTVQGKKLTTGALISYSGIKPHTAVGAVLTLRAQSGSAGKTLVNDGTTFNPILQDFVPLTANATQTRVLRSNETLALVAPQIVSSVLANYGGTPADAAATAAKLVSNPQLGVTTIVNAAGLSFQKGGVLVPLGSINGVPQLVAAGAGNLVAAGASNLIAAGAGNLVAAGAGNVIQLNGLSSLGILNGIISDNSAGVVATRQANLFNAGGLNLISQDGSGLISQDGSGLIVRDISKVISNDGSSAIAGQSALIGNDGTGLVAAGAGNLVAAGAGNLIAAGAGNLIAAGAGNLVAAGAGNFTTRAERPDDPDGARTKAFHTEVVGTAKGHPAQGSPANSVAVHATDGGLVVIGGGKIGN